MVVMKFRNSTDAAEFAEAYNGKHFNSMEVSHTWGGVDHFSAWCRSQKYAMSFMYYLS